MTTTKFIVVKFNFNNEITNWNNKTYETKEDANNAGNSWRNDCTVDQNIRKGRWFEIKEIKTYYAKSNKEHYTFRALDLSDARYWIINHLDCSQEWTLGEVLNPTTQVDTV
jgi:hypothetical protein